MSDLFGAPKKESRFDFLKASLTFGGSPDLPTELNLSVGPSELGFNVGYRWAPSDRDEVEQMKQDPLGLRHQGLFGSVFHKRFGHEKPKR